MNELDKKICDSMRILRMAESSADGEAVELSYSGGKDSDVILTLARMSGIKVRPIYKCTTIDPPGTIRHVRENGVEVMRPKETFFQLIERNGFPSRWVRFCCDILKEYKILDNSIQGIRKSESAKRAKNYKEPVVCRIYGSKKNHVNVFLPILDWTNDDVETFIGHYGVRCHPLYYDETGKFHVERRLGCIGCPLVADHGRKDFVRYPKMLRCWINAGQKWWDAPREKELKSKSSFKDIYEIMAFRLFFDTYDEFSIIKNGLFEDVDCKAFLEDYFKIEL